MADASVDSTVVAAAVLPVDDIPAEIPSAPVKALPGGDTGGDPMVNASVDSTVDARINHGVVASVNSGECTCRIIPYVGDNFGLRPSGDGV
jgi:hypothetical protein